MSRTRKVWIIGGTALVVALLLGAAAWFVFGGSSPAPPQLSATAPTVAPGDPNASSPDGTWKVAPGHGLYAGYRMQEQFAGDTIHKDAVGRTHAVSGTMTISDDQVTTANLAVQMKTLTSDRSARDDYLHTHALDSDAFPLATFVLDSPIALPSPRLGTPVHVKATGRLTLHGTTQQIALTLDARWNGSTIDVAGTAPITLADFGIEPPNTAVVSVADHGALELQLEFRRV